MPASKRPVCNGSRLIVQHPRIHKETARSLAHIGKSLGWRYNVTGRLLDMCVGLMAAYALSYPHRAPEGYGRLTVEAVRLIRRSKEKVAVLALEHGISEGMVGEIRARRSYRWVR